MTTKIKKFFLSNLSDWRSFVDSNLEARNHNRGNFIARILTSRSNKFDFVLSVCIVLLLIPYFRWFIEIHWNANKELWAHTEWLISYDGGFVRRGFAGELIKLVYFIFDVHPIHTIVIASMLCYTLVFCWLLKLCGQNYPICFLLSAMLLGSPITAGYAFNKDILIVLLYIISIQTILSAKHNYVKFILVNTICSIGAMTHELFIFICLPFIFLIHCKNVYNKIFTLRSLPFFSISFVFVILVILNRGNIEIAREIINSWNEIFQGTVPSYCCFELELAFIGIALDWFDQLPAQIYWWTKVYYGILWLPLIWLFLWLCCGIFVSKFIQHYDNGKEKLYIFLYFLHTITSIPVYLLAYDYGRWILQSTLISFITLYLIDGKISFNSKWKVGAPIWKGSLLNWQKVLIILCFGIPIHWNGIESQINISPIGYVIRVWIVPMF